MNAKRSSLFVNLSLVFFSALLVAVAAEIALRRMVAPPTKWLFPQESYIYDEEVNHLLRPGVDAYTHDKAVAINSVGIRDREYPPTPAPGVVRILALGDSQTFGNGLDLADTWPKQLERALNESSGRFEVLNCGVPATDTWQHRILLDRMIESYHPHCVVLAFYINDPVPSHRLSSSALTEMTNTMSKRVAYLLKRSALITYLQRSVRSLRLALRPSAAFIQGRHRLTGEKDEAVEKGWRQAETSLEEMKESCQGSNIRFVVIALPRRDQVDGTIEGRAYNDRIADICLRHSIEFVDMLPPLQKAYQAAGRDLFIPWDGHNSAIANAVIARRLAGFLSDRKRG